MPEPNPTIWYVSNRYHEKAACQHCGGIIRHENWCITLDPTVSYAYEIVADPSKLSAGDTIILHSLGAIWGPNPCAGQCAAKK